jgi:hypothetical protein
MRNLSWNPGGHLHILQALMLKPRSMTPWRWRYQLAGWVTWFTKPLLDVELKDQVADSLIPNIEIICCFERDVRTVPGCLAGLSRLMQDMIWQRGAGSLVLRKCWVALLQVACYCAGSEDVLTCFDTCGEWIWECISMNLVMRCIVQHKLPCWIERCWK